MSMTDPVADLLTRSATPSARGSRRLTCPRATSSIRSARCSATRDSSARCSRADDGRQGTLKVLLKYDEARRPAISEIRRSPKPGLRRYVKYTDIPKVMNGLGSRSSPLPGRARGHQARKQHLGGELIATVL